MAVFAVSPELYSSVKTPPHGRFLALVWKPDCGRGGARADCDIEPRHVEMNMSMNRSMHPPPNFGDASTSGSSLNDLGTTLAHADWSTIIAFGSIPVVAALIGYGTNILAIQMTFLPLEYIGYWEAGFRQCGFSFGWQGIIPANAAKIANITIDLVTRDILKVDEVFGRIDPQKIVEATRVPLHRALERILEELGAKHAPDVWTSLSLTAKAELAEQAAEMAETYVVAMVVEMRSEIHVLLDLHALCVGKLLEDKSLMNEIFRRCGEEEVRARAQRRHARAHTTYAIQL